MITILADHDVEGQAIQLWDTLVSEGWLELLPLQIVTFADINLGVESSDRMVWRFVQEKQMILVTNNRNMKGSDSLEQTLREENTASSLPVLTIGNVDRIVERAYRSRCVTRLIDILLDLDNYLGTARIFIP